MITRFMKQPYPLYVDEISPDEVKATVSDIDSYWANLRVMRMIIPRPERLLSRPEPFLEYFRLRQSYIGEKISGIHILPLGRFICMLTGSTGNRGMVLLDLIGKDELAERIAGKLGHADLQERFMEVYEDILNHPENHGKCEWVVGKGGSLWRPSRKAGPDH
jgi:hypothetical protein